jgi:hypothetical protein
MPHYRSVPIVPWKGPRPAPSLPAAGHRGPRVLPISRQGLGFTPVIPAMPKVDAGRTERQAYGGCGS